MSTCFIMDAKTPRFQQARKPVNTILCGSHRCRQKIIAYFVAALNKGKVGKNFIFLRNTTLKMQKIPIFLQNCT